VGSRARILRSIAYFACHVPEPSLILMN
jgi:hypothetical protein